MIALFQLWYFSAAKNQRINDSYALMCWYLENSFVIHILCALYFDWFMSSFFFIILFYCLRIEIVLPNDDVKKYLWPLAYTYIPGLLVYEINITYLIWNPGTMTMILHFLKWKVQNISGYCDALVEKVVW